MIKMRQHMFTLCAAFIFATIGFFFGSQAFYGWTIQIGPYTVPDWLSWVVVLLMFLMSVSALRLLK